jgi:hypothetical protein
LRPNCLVASLRPSSVAVARLVGLISLLLVVLAALAPRAPAALPSGFAGLQSWTDPTPAQWESMGQAKAGVFRVQLSWAGVETQAPDGDCTTGCTHHYRWGRYDAMFDQAASNGIQLLPVILGSPGWASPDKRWPPRTNTAAGRRNRAALYQFIQEATRRYGPGGSHWAGRTSVVPARYWQIWNEPNLPNYWWNKPNATEYGNLLKLATLRARQANGSVLTVAAGLPWGSVGMLPPEYLQKMFTSVSTLGRQPGFYAVALHPYAANPDLVMSGVRDVRRTLNRTSAKYRSIWMTEFGWSSEGPRSTFNVGRVRQAQYLKDAYNRLFAARASWRIKGAIWFNLVNFRASPDRWYYHTGLLASDGHTTKPAWSAFTCMTTGNC